ncbi:hypothetical protein JXR93_10165 [bacterium]|nr:hypothetical protein [bacterium]
MKQTFDIVLLNGRPAAGKSEVIDYLKKTPIEERIKRFHIGEFIEIDDFPILWERFEDDDLYEEFGEPRQISDKEFTYQGETLKGYTFKKRFFWHWLLRKLMNQYDRIIRDEPDFHEKKTVIFEFARGAEHGGWKEGYAHLSDVVLDNGVVVYIDVPWEESLRKNRRRFNPDKPDSWLEHALEDKKIEMMYKESDWAEFSSKDPEYLHISPVFKTDSVGKTFKVPYVVFNNMPEKTNQPEVLGAHLEEILQKAWEVKNRK